MNTAVISSIIGTVGAAFIAVLIFYLQGLRDDIRALGGRIDGVESGLRSDLGGRMESLESGLRSDLGGRIDGVESGLRSDLGGRMESLESGLRSDLGGRIDAMESRLGRVEESLIRIETVQEEHGRKLDGIADHGERISALEGAAAAMS